MQSLVLQTGDIPEVQDALAVAEKLSVVSSRINDYRISAESKTVSIRKHLRTEIDFKSLPDVEPSADGLRFHFKVPNNKEGQAWLKKMHEYLNHNGYTVACRGRGSRKESGNGWYIDLEHATEVAVYLNPKRIKPDDK